MLYSIRERKDGYNRGRSTGPGPEPDNGSSDPFGAPGRGPRQPRPGGNLAWSQGSGETVGPQRDRSPRRGGTDVSLAAGPMELATGGSTCGCDKRRKLILGALLAGAGFVAGRYIWPSR